MNNNGHSDAIRPPLRQDGPGAGRINILFLINDLKIGGAEKMLLYLISGLDRKLYNPVVCTLLDRGEYRHFVKSHGIKYYTLDMDGVFKVPFALYKLVKIVRKERVSIIHSYLFYSDIMARLAGLFAGTPVVITSMRNIDLWRKYRHIFIDSLTYNLSSAIISNSLAGAERLASVERIPKERIKVVYNAIKLDEYRAGERYDREAFRKSLGIAAGETAIVKVARLEEQKDHLTLLAVARHMKDEIACGASYAAGRRLRFVLVGGGSLEACLREKADELGVSDIVTFLGQRTDIKDVLRACDMFLLTSVYEGIPNAILEAQACGLPVVSTDVGGVSEIIEDGFNGLLCQPRDVGGIASKLWHYVANPAFASTVSSNAMARLVSKFSTESLIGKTEAIYRSLLVQHAPGIAHNFFPPEEFNVKFRILYLITSSDVGGAQKHLVTLVRHFLSKSHQIKVATSPGEPMNSSIRQLGIVPVTLDYLQKSINPIYDLITFYQLSRLLLENDFHIIHCHSTKAGIIGRIAATFAGVPVRIFTAHGFVFHDNMNFFKRYMCVLAEKLGAMFCDGIITVSRADLRKAIDYRVATKRQLRVVHNGVDASHFDGFQNAPSGRPELRAKYGVPEGALLAGSVGRLVREKSYATAIRALAGLPGGAYMIIAGEGYERPMLERVAAECGVAGRVIFAGEVPDPREIYAILDIFFLSSVKEGLPYSLLEAGACGVPVVATDAGGIPEVVEDGVTGLLSRSGDGASFAASLARMAGMTRQERAMMGSRLRVFVRSEFSEERMLLGVERFYARLAAGKGLLS